MIDSSSIAFRHHRYSLAMSVRDDILQYSRYMTMRPAELSYRDYVRQCLLNFAPPAGIV